MLRTRHLLKPWHAFVLLAALGFLTGCARHDQGEVKALLNRWFSLGDPVYFYSTRNCTAAVFETRGPSIKSALRLETEINRALFTLERTGTMAVKVDGVSPDQVFLTVINAERAIGVYVQQAAIEGRDCMDEETEGAFHAALSNPTGLFVWHPAEGALVLMDNDQGMVFFASGGA